MRYSKIAIIMAMKQEALPIIDHFGLKKDSTFYPIEVYANSDKSIILSLNGHSKRYNIDNIGTQAAAINAFSVLNNYDVDLVINCGTGGGFFEQGTKIGDVFIAKGEINFHNRLISISNNYQNYGLGKSPCLDLSQIAEVLDLKQGIISSGDSFDLNDSELELMKANQTNIKEMEAASVAWVCSLFDMDFTAVKVITDFVDKPADTSEDFISNFNLAVEKLKNAIVRIVKYLQN